LRANLYGVILGRSSFDHKTTALSKVGETVPWEQMPNAARLPGMFTEEGLYKELAEQPYGLVIRDEVGMLFASRNRRYTEFVIPFLTDAYGGWLNAKRLSSASYHSKEVALSILGATTYSEFARTTNEADWDSGWLVRWLFAVPDATYAPWETGRWPSDADHAVLNGIREQLSELNRRPPGPMLATQAALDHLIDWRKALIMEAVRTEDRHERVDAIIERYATYAHKFAMIVCAARGDGEKVTLQHAEDGARLAENYMTNVYRLYLYQQENRMTGALLNKALGLLNRHVEGLTRRELGQALHAKATQRDQIIERLLDAGAIEETKQGRTSRLFATQKRLPVMRVELKP
jgi:hypothetical protein